MGRREQPDRHLARRARLAGELALVRWLNAGLAAGRRRRSSTRPTWPCATWTSGWPLGRAAVRLSHRATARLRLATWNVLSGRARRRPARPGARWPATVARAGRRRRSRCRRSTTSSRGPGAVDQLGDLVVRAERRRRAVDRSLPADPARYAGPAPRSWAAARADGAAGALDRRTASRCCPGLPVRSWHSLRWTASWGRLPMLVPTPRGRVVPLLVPGRAARSARGRGRDRARCRSP